MPSGPRTDRNEEVVVLVLDELQFNLFHRDERSSRDINDVPGCIRTGRFMYLELRMVRVSGKVKGKRGGDVRYPGKDNFS